MAAAPHVATDGDQTSPSPAILEFYAGHSRFSTPGHYGEALDAMPSNPEDIARVVPGLVLYEHVAEPFYGCPIPDERRAESHIRPVEAILGAILALDGRPLDELRPPEARLVGICRHYALLAVSLLRQHGVPARVRSGFARYFDPTSYEDHWVCEYWKASESRWALLDAQLDEVFQQRLGIDFDVLDVPREQFLTAGKAWRRCRAGELDPQTFGIGFVKLHGLWFIATSLVRDVAALNKVEVLPWDA